MSEDDDILSVIDDLLTGETLTPQPAGEPTQPAAIAQPAAQPAVHMQPTEEPAVHMQPSEEPAELAEYTEDPVPLEYPTYDPQPNPAEFNDRLWGMLIGAAVGGAVGVPCVTASGDTLKERYREHPLEYPSNGPARGIYPLNDWPSEIDMMILVMRSMSAQERPVGQFAENVTHWLKNGFPELGDSEGIGCDQHVRTLAEEPDFASDPLGVSKEVRGVKTSAAPLVRSLPIAVIPSFGEYAIPYCQATHNDSRAIAATMFVTALVRELLVGMKPMPDLIRGPASLGVKFLTDQGSRHDFMHRLTEKDPLKIDLGGRDQPNHVFKACSAVMWAYRRLLRALSAAEKGTGDHLPPDALFKDTIREIAMEGGNTTTNCALAGAVLGASLGYTRLPEDWKNHLLDVQFIIDEIDQFMLGIGLVKPA